MRLILAFVALFTITPALCAPTPAPTGETVESLAASAKDKPVKLIKKLVPIAKEIADLVASISAADTQGASKSISSAAVPEPTPSQPASTKSTPSDSAAPNNQPASNVDNKVEQPSNSTSVDQMSSTTSPLPVDQKDPIAEPAVAQPDTGNGSQSSEEPIPTSAAADSSGDSPASPVPTESPADAPGSGSIQRRDLPTSTSAPVPTPTTSSAPDPSPTTSNASTPTLNRKDVLKLRQLLARATMYEQAIESVMVAQGKNIDDRPTDKTASGVAWGLANGPIMAVLGISGSNVVKKQPS